MATRNIEIHFVQIENNIISQKSSNVINNSRSHETLKVYRLLQMNPVERESRPSACCSPWVSCCSVSVWHLLATNPRQDTRCLRGVYRHSSGDVSPYTGKRDSNELVPSPLWSTPEWSARVELMHEEHMSNLIGWISRMIFEQMLQVIWVDERDAPLRDSFCL